MNSIIEGCQNCTEDMVNMIFESIIDDYKEMLKNV
jgi:hypothetical protein